jgi:KaiC/GvpD/RAD55 family RecA-like ATPase
LTKYALDQFDLIPAVQAPLIIPTKIEELIKVEDILREYKLPFKLLKMVNKESPGEPYRSSFLARLSNELAEEGLKHLEIVSLLKHVDERIKKYSDRQDQLVRLSQIADYALHKLKVENETVVYTFDQIHHHVETLDWIWPGWLPTTGFMILSSAPNVGKTQMMTQMAYCLKNGTKFLGVKAPDKHTPLVMSLEMDIRSLKYILDHQSKEWDGDISIAAIDEQSNFVTYENLIDQVKPTILLIDSLSELTDDDDNPASEAKRLMSWIKKIRRRYGLAVVLIHHNRKASEGNKKPKNLSDLYGAKDFARVADTVIQLWEDERLASKGLIEFSTVKVRFGVKEAFNIIRNENLWYRRESDDSSNRSKPTGRDKEGNTRKPGPSLRHRDSDNGTGSGTLRVRLGLKDTS